MKSRHLIFISVLLFAIASGALLHAGRPAEFKSVFSLFFRDWTKSNPLAEDAVIPVMATDGYRLPVDIGIASFSGGGNVSLNIASDSAGNIMMHLASTSITLTSVNPVASATQNSTQSMPVGLYASDQSLMQRLFTAIVMGDGVNGNNMLPFANYIWNGTSWDRQKMFSFSIASDSDGSIKMHLASTSITLASVNPVASATENSSQSMPVGLYASDQSLMQRLLTAIVMGDGVNGNNMLPMAQYLWNGASWDRAREFNFDADGNVTMKLASSSISLASTVASDTEGRQLVNIGSNTTVMVASISTGIVLQDVRSIASNTNTILADITSGTAAPFWLMIRNTGVQKIHVDSIAPDDTTDYIGAGEQYGPIYFGTNVANEKFRANSAGTSTWALTIRK